ncbi:MAG: DUF1361 domain-containing protein [Microbacterium sp.]|nr:MAG: DUF1361 domain-containing protein [Microbacterium sp.]
MGLRSRKPDPDVIRITGAPHNPREDIDRRQSRYLDRSGFVRHRVVLLLGLHAVVAVGIFLGRWSRLNSWEPVVSPGATAREILDAFAWSAAPALILTLFVVTAAGHFVTKAVVEAAWTSLRSALVRGGVVRDHVA